MKKVDLQKIIRRRKISECASGSAVKINVVNENWFCSENEELEEEMATPWIIRSKSVKKPIHILPSHARRDNSRPRSSAAPQDPEAIADAIASAYNLSRDQLKELLQALTISRLLLGYKHPILRNDSPPFTAA